MSVHVALLSDYLAYGYDPIVGFDEPTYMLYYQHVIAKGIGPKTDHPSHGAFKKKEMNNHTGPISKLPSP